MTTIQLEAKTKKKLEGLKESKRETFDDVVKRLMLLANRMEKEVRAHRLSSALLSEKSLAKDWLSKEDEKAWKDL